MIHPEIIVLAVVAIGALITLERFKQRPNVSPRSPLPSDDAVAKLDDRIARLEQAVDAIALETERIGESQRFLTKILAERSAAEREIS